MRRRCRSAIDKIRFVKPVFIGDTVTVTYTVTEVDEARSRSQAAIEVHNQHGALVAVAAHILKWVPAEVPGHPAIVPGRLA